jgi:hypothetical protein
MTPTIIVHIRPEKTGTDPFQRFCKEDRWTPLTHSVLYPMIVFLSSRAIGGWSRAERLSPA